MLVSYKDVGNWYFIVLIHIVQFAGAMRASSYAMRATGICGIGSHGDLERNPCGLEHNR